MNAAYFAALSAQVLEAIRAAPGGLTTDEINANVRSLTRVNKVLRSLRGKGLVVCGHTGYTCACASHCLHCAAPASAEERATQAVAVHQGRVRRAKEWILASLKRRGGAVRLRDARNNFHASRTDYQQPEQTWEDALAALAAEQAVHVQVAAGTSTLHLGARTDLSLGARTLSTAVQELTPDQVRAFAVDNRNRLSDLASGIPPTLLEKHALRWLCGIELDAWDTQQA